MDKVQELSNPKFLSVHRNTCVVLLPPATLRVPSDKFPRFCVFCGRYADTHKCVPF
jgi:hypothetical protein